MAGISLSGISVLEHKVICGINCVPSDVLSPTDANKNRRVRSITLVGDLVLVERDGYKDELIPIAALSRVVPGEDLSAQDLVAHQRDSVRDAMTQALGDFFPTMPMALETLEPAANGDGEARAPSDQAPPVKRGRGRPRKTKPE